MHIVHYAPSIDLSHGGVTRAVIDLAELTARAGRAVTVITPDGPDVPSSWRTGPSSSGDGVPGVVRLDPPPGVLGRLTARQASGVRGLVASADVVHLHTPWAFANLQLGAMARASGTPYVVTIHGMLDDWCMSQGGPKKRAYLALGGRRMLEGAFAVHCTADGERRQSEKWFPRGRARVIPLIVNLEPFRSLPGPGPADAAFGPSGTGDIDPASPVVLFLSRLHPKKGVEVLIRAAGLLRDRGCGLRLLLAGTGDEAYVAGLRALVSDLGLGGVVRELGLVTGELKLSLYERADVFALPTSQENFGFVLPEALACRTPAVTTRGVDIWPELERSGGTVLAEQTAEAFASAIGELLGRPRSEREAMGEAGRAWVFAELDEGSVTGRVLAMYDEAAAGARA